MPSVLGGSTIVGATGEQVEAGLRALATDVGTDLQRTKTGEGNIVGGLSELKRGCSVDRRRIGAI